MLSPDKRVLNNIELEDFQASAVEKIYQKSKNSFLNNENKNILLDAPVGSGKTVMGAFIVNFFKNRMSEFGLTDDYTFIWVSPNMGELNQQSADSFKNIFSENSNVSVVDMQSTISKNELDKNEVLFINWEAIGKKDNTLMEKDTEKNTFISVMNNTKYKQNLKRILIIDEAHINWKDSEEVKTLETIAADLIIYLTATPTNDLEKKSEIVSIPYSEPQEIGIIKNRLDINEGLDEVLKEELKDLDNDNVSRVKKDGFDLLSLEEKLLKIAIDKREELSKLSKSLNGDKFIEPLMIIQIPNYSNDNQYDLLSQEEIKEFLYKNNVLKSEIAVWLSGIKENVDNIESSNIKYIITKQAIATGWDCPRAHILLKFRQNKSESFDLQTIGRIMRIPRGLNYENEKLKTAYIYTPYSNFNYKKNSKSKINQLEENNNITTKLKDSFKKEIGVLGIPMYKKKQVKEIYVNSEKLYTILYDNIKKLELSVVDNATDKVVSTSIDANNDFEDKLEHNKDNSELLEYSKSFRQIKNEYYESMNKYSNHIYIEPILRDILINQLRLSNSPINEAYNLLYTTYVSNIAQIELTVKNALTQYRKEDNIIFEEDINYEIEEKVYLGQVYDKASSNYSYDKEPFDDTISDPENKFRHFLKNNKNIKYWFKNPISKESFSITYENNNTYREYYPDFIVFDNNDNLYFVDTKSNFNNNDFEDTSLKYEASIKYKNKKDVKEKLEKLGFNNFYFSMIKYSSNKSDEPFILLKDSFSKDITDWKSFEKLINN